MESTQRLMESPTLGKLAEALAKAQGEMDSAEKDSTNPHFKSKFADLASVRAAIKEPLSKNGLAYTQRATSTEKGVTVETTLMHASGEFVRDSLFLPVAQQTPQAFGSALTYARRYSLSAIVGVVSEEDDDGNAASMGGGAPPRPTPKSKPAPKPEAAPEVAADTAPKPWAGKSLASMSRPELAAEEGKLAKWLLNPRAEKSTRRKEVEDRLRQARSLIQDENELESVENAGAH